MPGVTLWDDCRAQVFELGIHEQGDDARLPISFRVAHVVDPAGVRGRSGRTSRATQERSDALRTFVEGDSWARPDELARFADRLLAVATFLASEGAMVPLGREFRLHARRDVFVPQLRISLTIDGNQYLPHPPAVPGHSDLTLTFWATDDALADFAEALDRLATQHGARSVWAARGYVRAAVPSPAGRVADRGEGEPADEAWLKDLADRSFYWEETEEPLRDPNMEAHEDEEWNRINEEWVVSHQRDRRHRRGSKDPDGAEPDADESDDAIDAERPRPSVEAELTAASRDAREEARSRRAARFASVEGDLEIHDADAERPDPSEGASAGGEPPAPGSWLDTASLGAADAEMAESSADERTGVIWPAGLRATSSSGSADANGPAANESAPAPNAFASAASPTPPPSDEPQRTDEPPTEAGASDAPRDEPPVPA